MKVGVIGLGRLGLPLAVFLSASGCEVIGVDKDVRLVTELNAGRPSLQEPEVQDLHGLIASTDYADMHGASPVFIMTPTPSLEDGSFSLEHVRSAVESVRPYLERNNLLAVASTVMPGHMDCLRVDCGLCYAPLFVALGSVMRDLRRPDFVLIGADRPEDSRRLCAFYRDTLNIDAPIRSLSFVEAEITKLALNCYLTVKISYANMLGELCEAFGADGSRVTEAIGLDCRIGGAYLRPGTAYGGPCFSRDNAALRHAAQEVGVSSSLNDDARVINDRQTTRLADQILGAERVAVLGLAYKPGTPVYEASAGMALVEALQAAGLDVIGHDPLARPTGIALAGDVAEAIAGADTVVIMTPWPEYRRLGLAGKRLIDPWGLYGNRIHDS